MSTIRHSAAIAECGCRLQDTGVVKGQMRELLRTIAHSAERKLPQCLCVANAVLGTENGKTAESVIPVVNRYGYREGRTERPERSIEK